MELVHDSGAMMVHGPFADMEGCADFFVAFALGEQLNDFAFADAELFAVLTDERSFPVSRAQMFKHH